MRILILSFIFNYSLIYGFKAVASVDKNRSSINETINFKIELEGADSFGDIDLSALTKNFTIVSGPSQQTSMQWINGKITNSRIISWSILPKKLGRVSIPPLKVEISGKKSVTKKINLFIEDSQEDTNELDVFISAELSQESAYLGEQITLTYNIYRKVECSIEPFEIPNFVGFWSEELFRPNQIKFKNISLNGVQYQKGTLYKVALFPISGKKIDIDPLVIKLQIQKKKKRRSRDPFFDPFFDSFFMETESKIIRSQKRTITIKEYPENRPSGFTGAVGSFKIFTETDMDTTNINEAITFRVVIEGNGNMGLFTIPALKFADNIDQFPPKETFDKNVFRNELSGKMIWEYILVPRVAGNLKIPSIGFTFFNPKTSKWQKLLSDPSLVIVNDIDNYFNKNKGLTKREIEVLGKDIKYIHSGNPNLKNLYSTSKNYIFIFYAISIFILSLPSIFHLIVGYSISNVPVKLSKNALKNALKAIKRARNDSVSIDSKVVYKFLKEKFQLSSANLDPTSLKNLLNDKIDDDHIHELIELVKLFDSQVYGNYNIKDIDILNDKTTEILKKIDEIY